MSYDTIDKLQKELDKNGVGKFIVISNNGYNLTLAGSFDIYYYHEIEITFEDIDFVSCPGGVFYINKFRKATDEEILELANHIKGYAKRGFVVCMENRHNEKFFVVAHGINYKWVTEYYYKRENLQTNEKIAKWVLEEQSEG